MEEELDYKEMIWELNSSGMKNIFDYHYESKVSSQNDPITPKELYDSYKKYITWWDREFGGRKPEFIKADEKKLNPEDYIKSGYYKKSFVISFPNPKRDQYLFGGIGINKLLKMLLIFKAVYDIDARNKWIQSQTKTDGIRENKSEQESYSSPF